MKKTDEHMVWRATRRVFHSYLKETRRVFHSYLKETKKKSTVNFYNLILYHFYTKSKGKQP